MTDTQPFLSIIIPAYNAGSTLPGTLEALERELATQQVVCEIIVVNSSPEGVDRAVTIRFPEVHVIHSPKRLYPGAARNVGTTHAAGQFFVFLDADAVPIEGWLESVVDVCRSNQADLYGGGLVNATPENLASQINHLFEYRDFLPGVPAGPRRFLPSGNMVCSRGIFSEIGPFDETMTACEDVLLGEKAAERGFRLHFDPSMAVKIVNRMTMSDVLMHAFQLGRGAGIARTSRNISGSWIRRFPPAILVLPFYRWGRIMTAVIQHRLIGPALLIPVAFLLLCAVLIWSIGFGIGLWGKSNPQQKAADTA